jgi:arabinose operon protein AraL
MGEGGPATLVFDIHGVLLGRSEPAGHENAGTVLAALRRAGHPLRFLTNSSSLPRSMLADQLACAGVETRVEEIYTAAITVAHYLRASSGGRRLYLIGSDSLRTEIDSACGSSIQWVGPEKADTLIVGRAPSLDPDLLACLARVPDLRVIATSRDAHFPDGARLAVGPGATVSKVEQALGRLAWVIGKPNPYALTEVMGLDARQLANTVVVGDSLAQDIALCANSNAHSVLVHNDDAPPDTAGSPWKPDHSIHALDQLFSILKARGASA